MVLTKDIVIDLIQILPDRQIQVRELRRVLEDGVVIGNGPYHRFVLDPGFHKVEDVRAINDDLFNVATVLWTPEIIQARKDFIQAQDATRNALETPPVVVG